MSIYLDDEPVELPGPDLAAALGQAQDRLGDPGRLIIEVQRDGQALSPAELDAAQDAPVAGSEWRLLTAVPRELAVATLQQVVQRLDDARQSQLAAAELLQQDQIAEAMKRVAEAVEAWQQTQQAVLYSATLVGIELGGRSVDDQPVDQTISLLLDQLKKVRDLLGAGDTVGLADALAYEWPETIDRWQALVGQMIEWVTE